MRRFWPLLLAVVLAPVFWFVVSKGSNVEQTTTRIVERRDPQAMADQIALEKEFEALAVYPGAEMTYYLSTSRAGGASVSANYRLSTPITWSDLRSHYEKTLAAASWRFDHEKIVKQWWRDVGVKQATYCKEGFSASIANSPGEEGQIADFGIDLGAGNMKFERCRE